MCVCVWGCVCVTMSVCVWWCSVSKYIGCLPNWLISISSTSSIKNTHIHCIQKHHKIVGRDFWRHRFQIFLSFLTHNSNNLSTGNETAEISDNIWFCTEVKGLTGCCFCYCSVPLLNTLTSHSMCTHTRTCTSTGAVHRVKGWRVWP